MITDAQLPQQRNKGKFVTSDNDHRAGTEDDVPVDLARLAHELRTPLSAIVVLSEIMRDERLGALGSPRYRAYAADIHDSATHANTVLSAFLDPAANGGNTSGPVVFIELDIAQTVGSTVSALVPVAERAGVTLIARLPEALPRVIADRRCVKQIMNNIIANALRFTPPGGRVVVTLSYVAGGPVRIEIADTGDGMGASELEQVRLGSARARGLHHRSSGSGIGLPLVRVLAAGCGATLEIDSALGKGTRVTIAFSHDRVVPV